MNTATVLLSLARSVIRRWKLIALVCLTVGALVAAKTMLSARDWMVTFAFVPENEKESGGSALAAELGLGGGGGEGPDFYVDLLKTNEVMLPLMAKKYVRSDNSRDSVTLVQLLKVTGGSADVRQATAIKILHRQIIPTAARRSGVVSVSVRLADPLIAKSVADDLLEAVNLVNTRVRQTKGRNDRLFTEQRLLVIRAELRAAEDALRNFLTSNRYLATAPALQVERMRLEREVTIGAATLESVEVAYESARRDEAKNTPRISVIERPRVPAIGQPRNTVRRVLLAMAFTGVVLTILGYFADQRANGSIRQLLREEWSRLRGMLASDKSHPSGAAHLSA